VLERPRAPGGRAKPVGAAEAATDVVDARVGTAAVAALAAADEIDRVGVAHDGARVAFAFSSTSASAAATEAGAEPTSTRSYALLRSRRTLQRLAAPRVEVPVCGLAGGTGLGTVRGIARRPFAIGRFLQALLELGAVARELRFEGVTMSVDPRADRARARVTLGALLRHVATFLHVRRVELTELS
jgi:hypothetical protein